MEQLLGVSRGLCTPVLSREESKSITARLFSPLFFLSVLSVLFQGRILTLPLIEKTAVQRSVNCILCWTVGQTGRSAWFWDLPLLFADLGPTDEDFSEAEVTQHGVLITCIPSPG